MEIPGHISAEIDIHRSSRRSSCSALRAFAIQIINHSALSSRAPGQSHMAHSIQRLTIFALLSALEIDIREFIKLYIMPTVGKASLFNASLRSRCADRFRHNNPDATPDADDLIDYLDLGDAIQLLRANEVAVDPSMRTYLKRYYLSLDAMIPIRNRVMHSRPLEFDDLMRVTDLARSLTGSYSLLWANLRTNIRALDRDPEYATTLAIPELTEEAVKILHNLPQSEFDDTGFMGREKEITSLKKALADTYPIVTIVGKGGQGKTALALNVCYDLLDDNQI
jgi:LuxR family transcriptional regulator, glucitol operon activator